MSQLATRYPKIKSAGGEVLLISFAGTEYTEGWAREHKLPYLIGLDPKRLAYARYGLENGKLLDLAGPKALFAGFKTLIATGETPKPMPNFEQLGGYFVVDRYGLILYAYYSRGPGDQPPIEELVGKMTHETVV